MFITFMVSAKIPVVKFSISPHTWQSKTMLTISLEYTSASHKSDVHDLVNVYIQQTYMFKLKGQETQNTQEIKRTLFDNTEQDKTCKFSM